jgi:hypothetical protein
MRITLEDVAYRLLPRVEPGRALAHREWSTLVSAAEVLLEGSPHDGAPHRIADNVENFLIAGRSRRAWRVRLLLELVEWLPVFETARRFGRLPRRERRALVEAKWINDPRNLWRICAKIRDLVILGAYGDSQAVVLTGYVPVPLRPRFKHLSRPPASEVA